MKTLGYFLLATSISLFQNVDLVQADTVLSASQNSQVQAFLQSQANWNNLIANELQKSAGTQVMPPVIGTTQGINQHTLDSDCNVKVVPPAQKGTLSVGSQADNDQTQIPMFTVTIDGSGCPVQINASIDGEQTATGFHAGVILSVKAIDPVYAKQNDVDTVDMTMDMTAILTQKPGNVSDVQVSLSLKGQAHSLSLGNVFESASITTTLDVTPPAAGAFFPALTMKMGEELKYQFSGFDADLVSSMDLEGILGPLTANYSINGATVSQSDFQKFLGSISLPLSQNPTTTPPPSNSMSCEARVYDGKQVSKQALLDSISKDTPIAAKPLLDEKTTTSSNWQITGGAQAKIDFESQYVTLTLSVPASNQTNELTLLTGQSGDVADQVGNFTFRLTCTEAAQ